MIDAQKLIRALRCASTVPGNETDCLTYSYCTKEEVNEKYPIPHDAEINGVKYWLGCDGDKIMQDAAYMLEELTNDKSGID